MQGHARTAGKIAGTLKIAGKEYTLRPHLLGISAEMEAFIVARREDPIVVAARNAKQVPEEFRQLLFDSAMRQACKARTVTAEEQNDFEASLLGLAFKLWVCLRQDHGDEIKTPHDAMALIEQAGEDAIAEIAAQVHVASGMADLGN